MKWIPLTRVSEHEDIGAGVAAGKHQVEAEDFDFGYDLYAYGVKVASLAEGRMGYPEWARRSGRLDYIHSVDDRYDQAMTGSAHPTEESGSDFATTS